MEDRMLIYRRNATLDNLCAEYSGRWGQCHGDKKKLFEFAMQQQALPHLLTYAYNGRGLTKEYLQDAFKDYINGKYTAIDADGVAGNYTTQLYVGYNGILSDDNDVIALMWVNSPTFFIKRLKATKIYVGCKSDISVVCGGYNTAIIMLFDESRVCLEDIDSDSVVTVYRYSDKASLTLGKYCLGKVKVFDKELRL